MLHTALIPHPVAPSCYLREALLWVAVQRLPLLVWNERSHDVREDLQSIEGLDPIAPDNEPLSDAESSRLGLPPDPKREFYDAGESYASPEEYRGLMAKLEVDSDLYRRWAEELAVAERLYEQKAIWDPDFEAIMEIHEAKLYVALREGRVGARGKLLPKATIEEAWTELEATDWKDWHTAPWSDIPPNFWMSQKIDWAQSSAEGRNAAYALILLDFEPLYAHFRPQIERAEDVVRVGDTYAIQKSEIDLVTPTAPRGRPPLDWDSFHVEVARRFRDNRVPAKQEAFILEMQEWCHGAWAKQVARSTILGKVRPYYTHLVRPTKK